MLSQDENVEERKIVMEEETDDLFPPAMKPEELEQAEVVPVAEMQERTKDDEGKPIPTTTDVMRGFETVFCSRNSG